MRRIPALRAIPKRDPAPMMPGGARNIANHATHQDPWIPAAKYAIAEALARIPSLMLQTGALNTVRNATQGRLRPSNAFYATRKDLISIPTLTRLTGEVSIAATVILAALKLVTVWSATLVSSPVIRVRMAPDG